MSMAEKSLRFGVRDPVTGLCAATWKLSTSDGKPDVYLFCRPVGNAVKLSLHESGQWHFAFGDKGLFEKGSLPKSRFLGVYEKAPHIAPGITLACRVHTPWFACTVAPDSKEEPGMLWLEPAQEGHSIEVAIFLYEGPRQPNDWPGRDGKKTSFVGELELAGGGRVVAVALPAPFVDLLPQQASAPRFFKGKSIEDLQGPGNRAMGWGRHPDGSIVVMEGPVLIQ